MAGGSIEHFIDGLNAIIEATIEDRKWPWPVCQLAEIVEKYTEMVDMARAGRIQNFIPYPDQRIWDLFLNKDSLGLWSEGAKLAAACPETK